MTDKLLEKMYDIINSINSQVKREITHEEYTEMLYSLKKDKGIFKGKGYTKAINILYKEAINKKPDKAKQPINYAQKGTKLPYYGFYQYSSDRKP